MLEHQEANSESSQPAAQVRVKSEELARALASIEARRQEEARQLEGTVVIGDVVQELQLDATPEEIFAEVQAQRQRHSQEAQPAPEQVLEQTSDQEAWQEFRKSMKIGGGIVASLMIFFYIVSAESRTAYHEVIPPPPIVTYPQPPMTSYGNATQPFLPYNVAFQQHYNTPADTMDAEFYRKLALSTGPNPTYQIGRVPLAGTSPYQTTYPIRAIPDGYTIVEQDVDNVKFYQKIPVVMFQEVREQRYQTSQPLWLLTRYNGRFYRRVWIRPKDIPALKQGHQVFLRPTPDGGPGEQLRPLTLAEGDYPTNAYRGPLHYAYQSCYQNHGGRPALLLPEGKKVTLDRHAWEDFPRMTLPEYRPPAWSRQPGVFSNVYNSQDQDACSPAFDASAVVQPLSEVPNGRPVFCNFYTIRELILNRPFSQLPVDTRPQLYVSSDSDEKRHKPWMVVKLAGVAYLRAWIAQRITQKELTGRTITVFPGPHATEFIGKPVQITLRLSNFRTAGTENGKIVMTNVLLDKHAWEQG